MRGIPPILLLIILYNLTYRSFDALSQTYGWGITSAVIPKTMVAILALSLSSTAFMAESIRTALLSVPSGQREAACSIGLTKWDIMRRIILPQALPVAIPIMGSTFINLLKATALVNLVGVIGVLNAAIIRVNTNYKYLEAYLTTALIYWLLTIVIEKLVKRLSKWSARWIGTEALT
jgi:ABC-type amino acid transport system permease subunit